MTATQIGTARQMGVLSEEALYNATGLQGEEAVSAFAASSMQNTAGWLRGNQGRRLVASLAGKDGHINQDAVQQILSGNMSVADTIARDNTMKTQVGKANFIRNEGRLRGEALGALGGFGHAIQLRDWANSKGIDINSMDDRAMVFAQRQFGMSREETEAAVQMVNNMPAIANRQKDASQDDAYFQKLAQSRKSRGIEGLHQRMDQAREQVNSKLQKFGQDIFNEGSEQIDAFLNRLTGTYVQTVSADLDDQYRRMRRTGAGGSAFGLGLGGYGGSFSKGGQRLGLQALRTSGEFGGPGAGSLFNQMNAGSDMSIEQAVAGESVHGDSVLARMTGLTGARYARDLISTTLTGQSGMSKLREAGFNMEGIDRSSKLSAKLQQISSMERAAATGYNDLQVAAGADNASWIRDAYARGDVTGSGDKRMDAFGAALKRNGTSAMISQWEQGSPEQRAQLMANLERGAGIKGENALSNKLKMPSNLGSLERGKFNSVEEENLAYSQAFGTGGGQTAGAKASGFALGAMFRSATGIFGNLAGDQLDKFGEGLASRWSGATGRANVEGEFWKSTEGRDLTNSLFTGSLGSQSAGYKNLELRLANMDEKDPLRASLAGMLDAADYYKRLGENGGNPLSAKADKDWEASHKGTTAAQAQERIGRAQNAHTAQLRKDISAQATKVKAQAEESVDKLRGLGVYDAATGQLTTAARADLDKAGKNFGALAGAEMRQLGFEARLDTTEQGAALAQRSFELIRQGGAARDTLLSSMTPAELDKYAKAAGKFGLETAGEAAETSAMQKRFDKTSFRQGKGAAVKGILGVDIDKDTMNQLFSGKGGLTDEAARGILARSGIKKEFLDSKDGEEMVKNFVSGAGPAGGPSGMGRALSNITHSKVFTDAQKEKADKGAEQSDPTYRLQMKIKENGDKMNTALDKLVLYSGKTADEITNLKKLDPENKGGTK